MLGVDEQEIFGLEYGDQLLIIDATNSGIIGLIYALTFMPDYILTDILMASEILGIEMIQYLRQFPETRQIPFSFITARSKSRFSEHYPEELIEVAHAYIAKPFGAENLLAIVGDYLGLTPLPHGPWRNKSN